MADAYIVDAVRSPTGRRKGGLAHVHGADLGAHVLKTLVERNNIPDSEYDDVEADERDPPPAHKDHTQPSLLHDVFLPGLAFGWLNDPQRRGPE